MNLCERCHEVVLPNPVYLDGGDGEDVLSPGEYWHPKCWRLMLLEHPAEEGQEFWSQTTIYSFGFDEFLEYLETRPQRGVWVH